ncbi:MAG: hypothetical protein GKR94_16105 [Gammaproteobacteria bacterium]|nr:hypothetical protein [Gammaproteobacteria bacterium]
MTTETKSMSWPGLSGREYRYFIYPIGTTFKAAPGNYIFSKKVSPGRHRPIYIGETGDLSERFDSHHKMPCITGQGATHIQVHQTDGGPGVRRQEESELVAKWQPVCNG